MSFVMLTKNVKYVTEPSTFIDIDVTRSDNVVDLTTVPLLALCQSTLISDKSKLVLPDLIILLHIKGTTVSHVLIITRRKILVLSHDSPSINDKMVTTPTQKFILTWEMQLERGSSCIIEKNTATNTANTSRSNILNAQPKFIPWCLIVCCHLKKQGLENLGVHAEHIPGYNFKIDDENNNEDIMIIAFQIVLSMCHAITN